jgi:signal transduction histidine kinase
MKLFDPASLLKVGAETYRALFERNGNTLLINVPDSLPQVYGNTDMLLHVLSNLFSNANRYTRNGRITIEAKEEDNDIIITVQDNGSGIKPELLPHVLERGISDSGTGLGLSICKTTIDAHNGTMSVDSEYGKGTTVSFTLPIYKNNEEDEKDE